MIRAAIRRRLRDRESRLAHTLAGLSHRMIRLYENCNGDFRTNGEFTVLEKLATRELRVLFDVGANLGVYTRELARLFPEAEIHKFPARSRGGRFRP